MSTPPRAPREHPEPEQRVRPPVTVVIPVHGDRGEIRHTADALSRQDYAGPMDVIVVDNGDNVGLESSLGSLASLSILHEAKPGSYAARNAAVRRATGTVLAFTDGDCLPQPGWLTAGVDALSEGGPRAFVGGRIRLFAQNPARPSWAELWDSTNGLRQDHYVLEQGWAATANMLTMRSTFDDVGEFDERLKSGGDREWGMRARDRGVRPVFSPLAVVDHPARPTMRELHIKVRRVTGGDVDARGTRNDPVFDPGTLWPSLRPNTRSIVNRSEQVSPGWTVDRVRYVLVAHWLQYYFLISRVSHAARRRRPRR